MVRSGAGTGESMWPLLSAIPGRPLRIGAITTLATAICAVKVVSLGWLPYGPPPPPHRPGDPVLATVGPAPIRVSDLRAQAGAAQQTVAAEVLVRQGYLDDAAQQLALAQAAEADGLHEALEVRAALALARRRVLSEAYLDLAVSRSVTPQAVEAEYLREVNVARAHDRVTLRHMQFAEKSAAEAAKRRADRGERFDRLAAALSEDRSTRASGGSFGMVHPDALPPSLAEVARTAPIGQVLGPIKTDAGYHLVRVDARRQLAVPTLAARTPAIADALRARAMRQAAVDAEQVAGIDRQAQSTPPVALTQDGGSPGGQGTIDLQAARRP